MSNDLGPRRIVCCTSILQVINARSAIEIQKRRLRDESGSEILVISHPGLSQDVKNKISTVARQIGFSQIVDLSAQVIDASYFSTNRKTLRTLITSPRAFCAELKERLKKFSAVKDIIRKEFGLTKSVNVECYLRLSPKEIDNAFIDAMPPGVHFVGIEDGFGNYLGVAWAVKHLNVYEIKFLIKMGIVKTAVFLASVVCTANIPDSRALYFKRRSIIGDRYSNLKYPGSIDASAEFLNQVRQLASQYEWSPECEVLILDTKLSGQNMSFSIDDEVDFYDEWINKIARHLDISTRKIMYRPHPRLDPEVLTKKRERLNCVVLSGDSAPLAEIDLCNPSLRAVYSVGSTALIYSKIIFGIAAFRIPVEETKMHPSTFRKFRTLCEKFEIPEFSG